MPPYVIGDIDAISGACYALGVGFARRKLYDDRGIALDCLALCRRLTYGAAQTAVCFLAEFLALTRYHIDERFFRLGAVPATLSSVVCQISLISPLL